MTNIEVELQKIVVYDEETDEIRWLVTDKRKHRSKGKVVGGKQANGRWRCTIDGTTYSKNRLKLCLQTGVLPPANNGTDLRTKPQKEDKSDRSFFNTCDAMLVEEERATDFLINVAFKQESKHWQLAIKDVARQL